MIQINSNQIMSESHLQISPKHQNMLTSDSFKARLLTTPVQNVQRMTIRLSSYICFDSEFK